MLVSFCHLYDALILNYVEMNPKYDIKLNSVVIHARSLGSERCKVIRSLPLLTGLIPCKWVGLIRIPSLCANFFVSVMNN